MKVVELPRTNANPDVLKVARLIAELAESGELQSIAMVGMARDGGTHLMRAGLQNAAVVGRLEHLKHKIVQEFE